MRSFVLARLVLARLVLARLAHEQSGLFGGILWLFEFGGFSNSQNKIAEQKKTHFVTPIRRTKKRIS